MTKLVGWISPFNGYGVVTSQKRLDHIVAIHEVSTWAEFAKVDPLAYADACESYDGAEEPKPSDDDPFAVSMVPGFDDGDYPPWLQAEMDLYVPDDILRAHARPESSVINGRFWVLEASELDSMLQALRERGYEVERVNDIPYG